MWLNTCIESWTHTYLPFAEFFLHERETSSKAFEVTDVCFQSADWYRIDMGGDEGRELCFFMPLQGVHK